MSDVKREEWLENAYTSFVEYKDHGDAISCRSIIGDVFSIDRELSKKMEAELDIEEGDDSIADKRMNEQDIRDELSEMEHLLSVILRYVQYVRKNIINLKKNYE